MPSLMKRTVENGGRFSQSLTTPLRREYKICPGCGQEKAEVFDHLIPWQWGGTNAANNLAIWCHDCNHKKTAFEDFIENETSLSDTLSQQLMQRHIEYWTRRQFTPAGNRHRPIILARESIAATKARRIHKRKAMARQLKDKMRDVDAYFSRYSEAMLDLMEEIGELPDNLDREVVRRFKHQHHIAANVRKTKTGRRRVYLRELLNK